MSGYVRSLGAHLRLLEAKWASLRTWTWLRSPLLLSLAQFFSCLSSRCSDSLPPQDYQSLQTYLVDSSYINIVGSEFPCDNRGSTFSTIKIFLWCANIPWSCIEIDRFNDSILSDIARLNDQSTAAMARFDTNKVCLGYLLYSPDDDRESSAILNRSASSLTEDTIHTFTSPHA